jgi:hypothetical protein
MSEDTNKTGSQKLVNESKEGLSAYLSSGKINRDNLASKLDFSGLEIDNFDRLKRIHFTLSEDVIGFVEDLPEHIRRINTESRRERKTTKGEIKGRIEWNQTIKKRYSQNYKDKSLFVTKNPYIEYNIPENLVLKKVLGIIYDVIDQELEDIDYDWREEKWSDDLIEEMNRIYNKNVHVDRIKDRHDIRLSNKNLEAARTSRKKIYRDAHDLYIKYQKLMDNQFDDEEVEKILSETLIRPGDKYTLFEIFVIVKIVENFGQEYELKSIRGSEEFARLEKADKEIKVFYDGQGSFEFEEGFDRNEGSSRFMQKSEEISEGYSQARKFFLNKNKANYSLYSGEPDIIIEFRSDEGLEKVVIGEIKYTDKEKTVSDGLEQLIEYLKFARIGDSGYLENEYKLKGLIVTDRMNFEECEKTEITIKPLNTEKLIDSDFKLFNK